MPKNDPLVSSSIPSVAADGSISKVSAPATGSMSSTICRVPPVIAGVPPLLAPVDAFELLPTSRRGGSEVSGAGSAGRAGSFAAATHGPGHRRGLEGSGAPDVPHGADWHTTEASELPAGLW